MIGPFGGGASSLFTLEPGTLNSMTKTLTGSKPLPLHRRVQRFFLVGWAFLMVYLTYKRIQRNKKLAPAERERRYKRAHRQNAERIYRLAIRMEGLMIKTCQFISSRADVAPTEYVAVLSRLQDTVPARPFAEVEAQILRELGTVSYTHLTLPTT